MLEEQHEQRAIPQPGMRLVPEEALLEVAGGFQQLLQLLVGPVLGRDEVTSEQGLRHRSFLEFRGRWLLVRPDAAGRCH
jgi:hypothetical protein